MMNYYNSEPMLEASNKDGSKSALASILGKSKSIFGLVMFMILTLGQVSWAQSTANYTFSTNATSSLALDLNGNAINMSTGTTQVLGAGIDDAVSSLTNFNLGTGSSFIFNFMGVSYSQFAVSDNGILTFGATPGTAVYTIGANSTPALSAFANDMRTGSDGKVEAKVFGTANNRTIVVQWTNNMIRYLNPAIAGSGTFQVRLYESTGIIEYVYGTMATNSSTPTVYNVGFSSNTTINNVFSVNTATNATSTAAAPAITNTYSASSTVTDLTSTSNGSRKAYIFIPPGNPGNTVLATLAPPTALTFAAVTASGMTLNWTASAPTTNILKYAVYVSSDSGANYNYVTTTNLGTNTYTATGLVPNTNYFWKVYAISEGGKSSDLIASQTTLPAGNISAIASGNWSATSTWSSGTIPTATDNVTIPTGFTVTEDVTAATAYSLLVTGDLVYTVTTARTLTVVTDVTINSGGSIKSAATGTVLTHSLVVGGNLVNNGTIDFSTNTNTAAATITFNTAGNANFTLGAGSITNLKNAAGVTLNKGTNITNVLTFNPGGTLTVQGANALGFMVITNGLLKLDGTNTFNNPLFATAGYTIATTGGYWQNNPNATILGLAGSPSMNGLLRLTSGIFNIGSATGNSMAFGAGSTINIEGGTINAASRFGTTAAGTLINYTQTGGTINVNQIGNTSATLASFDLGTNTASLINFTAGTVNVVLANTATSGPRDVRGSGVFTPNMIGTGTINFGTAASGATPLTFYVSGAVPNLVINTTSAIHNLSVANATSNNQTFGNLTIPTGSTFNLNGFQFILRGTNVINNGTLTGTAAGSSLYFFSGTSPQSYSGTGVCTPGLVALAVDTAPNTFTVDPASSGLNPLRVNLFSGNIINSNKITIGTGLAVATAVQTGAAASTIPGGSFDVSPTWNLGTGVHTLIYAQESVARISGFEVNPTRIVNALSVDNTNGVTINGGDLNAITSLALTNGIVTTGSNTLVLGNATTVGALTGGTATAYVNGALTRSIANASTNATYVTYPIGKSGIYTPIALAPATTSIALFKAESFGSNTGSADPSIMGLSSTRRFEALPVSGTFTTINVRLSDAGIVTGNIPVQAPSATGAYAAAFGSTATFAAGPPITLTSTTPVTTANYTGYLSYATSNICSGTPTPGLTTATTTTICLGGSTTLGITTTPVGSGITYQWQSSPDNVTYTNIASATNSTYTATPTTATWYQCIVTCSAGPVSGTSTPIQITFTNSVTATTPGTVCGQGAVTLGATPSTGATINWYAASTGGNVLNTGNTFVTPSLTTNTTYYAQATSVGASATVGPVSPTAHGGTIGAQTVAWNVNFTVLQSTKLISVDIFPITSGQNGEIIIRSSGGTVISTIPYTTTVSGGATAQTIMLNYDFAPGSYQLYPTLPTSGINRNVSGAVYPYTSTIANITGNGYDATYFMGFYKWTFSSNCDSPRVPVIATVTTAPTLTLSSATTTICSGQTSAPITITTGASDYDTYTFTPNTGVSGTAGTGFSFNPTTTTTYTLTASQSAGSLCSTTQTVTVNVNATPTAITIAPTSATTCANSIQTLTATGGTIGGPGSSNIGTATTFTDQATNADPTVFCNRYDHTWQQMVFTQAELNAAGIQAGNINALKFNINTIGSAANVTDFRIFMGATSASTLTGFISTGLSEVFAAATYTQTLGINTITLNTPYVWNGTSNIVIDIRNTGIDSANNASTYYTATTDNKAAFAYTSTATTSSNAYVATNPTATLSLKRMNVTFDWSNAQTTTLTWSPITNLYTDALATVPYTAGTNATTVYHMATAATAATTYTATATSAATCTSSATTSITVNATPVAPTAIAQSFCGSATVANLATTSGTGIQWYANATGGSPLASTVALTSTTYYASQTVSGCESPRTSVAVTINTTAQPTASSPQSFTAPATIANIVVTGTTGTVIWYPTSADAIANTNALASTTTLVNNTTYYVTQTIAGCPSTPVAVLVNVTLRNNSFDMSSLEYYPNPVIDVLNISYSNTISSIEVYNLVGQLVRTTKPNATTTQLDMNGLPTATYLVKVTSEGKTADIKIVKK